MEQQQEEDIHHCGQDARENLVNGVRRLYIDKDTVKEKYI